MNVDEFGESICQVLNQNENIWTWKAQQSNNYNWVRVFKETWAEVAPAGRLKLATQYGVAVTGPYPVIWFQINGNPNGPFSLYVPVSDKGYSRQAREEIYPLFLNNLFLVSNIAWPSIHQGIDNYQNDHHQEYIPIDEQNALLQNVVTYINNYYPVIDQAMALMP